MDSGRGDLQKTGQSSVLLQVGEEKIDIGLVGLDGIFCESFLRDQMMEKEFSCRNKLSRDLLGSMAKRTGLEGKKDARGRMAATGVSVGLLSLSAPSDAVKLAELATGFRLFAPFFYARLFVVLTTLQFSFDSVNLKFLFQLTDGVFKISTNFNFYHLGLRWDDMMEKNPAMGTCTPGFQQKNKKMMTTILFI